NTNHTLPQVYTVIAWLCCTIATFEGIESHSTVNRNLAFDSSQNVYEQVSWEFYIRIFNQISYDFESNTEVELRDFRSKLEEEFCIKSQVPITDLEEQVREKKRCLDDVIALGDPRAVSFLKLL
ncbi:unnamed protein product, partial [Allacma fusca]